MTKTSSFGVGNREGHDSSDFYDRRLFDDLPGESPGLPVADVSDPSNWVDRIYCADSRNLGWLTDRSIALAFTSPPYATGKEYDKNFNLEEYLELISLVGSEVYRVLMPGGRYVVNIAGLGRCPYIPMQAYFWNLHQDIGFLPFGEVIWRKGKGMNGNCAWGSWRSSKSPRLRDVHEYLQFYCKESFSRPDKGISTIESDEFMMSTLSVWDIPPESAKRIGHPAPFPLSLAERVIILLSYQGDIVLDPFVGSGTTCLAAKHLNRHWVGVDISEEYCRLAIERLR